MIREEMISILSHGINDIGGDQALRVMAGQTRATNRDWAEMAISLIITDIFKFMEKTPIFLFSSDGNMLPFEELFLI